MTNAETQSEAATKINYAKYLAKPMRAYEFVALLVGVDPDSIQKSINYHWQGMPIRLTNYSDEQLCLFKEYYQSISTWYPAEPMPFSTWLLGAEKDVDVWLERLLLEIYPLSNDVPQEMMEKAKIRFLKKFGINEKYALQFPLLSSFFLPNNDDIENQDIEEKNDLKVEKCSSKILPESPKKKAQSQRSNKTIALLSSLNETFFENNLTGVRDLYNYLSGKDVGKAHAIEKFVESFKKYIMPSENKDEKAITKKSYTLKALFKPDYGEARMEDFIQLNDDILMLIDVSKNDSSKRWYEKSKLVLFASDEDFTKVDIKHKVTLGGLRTYITNFLKNGHY